jgi:hypothetical protein
MVAGAGIIVGVAGRAGAHEHRAWRYDEVEEAQRRLRQREAQLRAPDAERPSEEVGEHLLLFVRCGSTFVVRAPINARRASTGEVVALLALQMLANQWDEQCHSGRTANLTSPATTQSMRRQSCAEKS